MVSSSLAQLVESLTLKSDVAGSRPVVVTFFFHANYLSYLLLMYISEVFEFKHVFSLFFLPVVEIADNGCIQIDGPDATLLSLVDLQY